MSTYTVAILLQKEEREGWNTKVTSALNLWVNDANSEAEARGMATEVAMSQNAGFHVVMLTAIEVKHENP